VANYIYSIGIDPGPTTGIAVLRWTCWPARGDNPPRSGLTGRRVLQCDQGTAALVVVALLDRHRDGTVHAAVEKFITGPRAAHLQHAEGEATADLAATLASLIERRGRRVARRSAAEVKPWATDDRITAAGLADLTKGMPHARDACRHALYAGVRDARMPDPLSIREGGAR
jgi:hypothetical protein